MIPIKHLWKIIQDSTDHAEARNPHVPKKQAAAPCLKTAQKVLAD